jgi:hypothetical protein
MRWRGLLPVGIAAVIAGSKSFAAIGWSTLAHVILCWLALLLIRVAENHTGQTWPAMRRELQRIAIGTFTGPVGTFRQRTDITKTTRDLLTALKIDAPPQDPRAHHAPGLNRTEPFTTSRHLETRPAASQPAFPKVTGPFVTLGQRNYAEPRSGGAQADDEGPAAQTRTDQAETTGKCRSSKGWSISRPRPLV